MEIKKFLLLLGCLAAFETSCFSPDKAQPFARIPVAFFPFTDKPVIKTEIEGKTHRLLVDLGSSHPIDLQKPFLDLLKNKQPLGPQNYIGFKGGIYSVQAFKIPFLKLPNLVMEGLICFEEHPDFKSDAQIGTPKFLDRVKDQIELAVIQGRIGWSVFTKFCCFFDFPHSSIVLADSLATLINEANCPLEGFKKIPLEIESFGVVISLETDAGVKKFMMDTGATGSILREPLKTEGGKNYRLMINGHDLGTLNFVFFTYSDQFACDGILGVDFFKKHVICFDFQNKTAYIR